MFDMPLAQLQKYMGTNPKPADFADFWSRALEELSAQSLHYELIPATFQTTVASCYHLYFTGVGGARVHCQLVKPREQKQKGPGLVWFHGYHTNSGDWVDKLAYAAAGFTVLAMDCRGQGGKSEDNLQVKGPTLKGHIIRGIEDPNPHHLYYRNVFLDTVQAVRILCSMDHIDRERIGVYGASQGGALALACAALEPSVVKKAVVLYPFLSDYKRAQELDMKNTAYEEIHYYFRFLDPTHEREEEVFYKLGYIDIQHLADRICADVLWAVALEDHICPPSTQFAVYNKIKSKKDMVLFYEYGHEYLPTMGDRAYLFFADLLSNPKEKR
ncbi:MULTISPECIES: acetylxylan esterase [Anoxybacillaceae]|uniref:Acetyl xylan esterase n=1 Tax=Parageobacillus caldoxylosilyticus NBRC 107762 TaxID=1220594 RepID=A0A023DF52_9BACL|nr:MULTISPECIES: alpha/beta fold hydrolase [Bacillaceae]MED4971842.1 alpha/beta fold hydrolase [Geobacillus thermoleovorans]WJP98987.1 alpha/beta fold hydrolase [Geobacillus stearothermophilus]MBB3853110.1 cephalosporin-C deacetylase [Parageobacillus caldoxylosilyticus]QCK83068.1 alpha/beta fold hydrolase [Geobacillus kaustophilus NBRC 102445]QNU26212.1 alpha/beta fold hydrolase [Geobacillus zalihae]